MFDPAPYLVARLVAAALLLASPALGQGSSNPFTTPIAATEGMITVNFVEFATIPDISNESPRIMLLVDEPGTRRLFVNTMRGPLYSVSYDGKTVVSYLDLNAAEWGNPVQFNFTERGFQSFAFHPQFNQRGTAGFGKFYTSHKGKPPAPRADLRLAVGPQRQMFVLNKHDGIIRLLVP